MNFVFSWFVLFFWKSRIMDCFLKLSIQQWWFSSFLPCLQNPLLLIDIRISKIRTYYFLYFENKKFVPLQLSKFDLFFYQIFNSVLRREQPNNTVTFRGLISVSHSYHMVEKFQKDKTMCLSFLDIYFCLFFENLEWTSFKNEWVFSPLTNIPISTEIIQNTSVLVLIVFYSCNKITKTQI